MSQTGTRGASGDDAWARCETGERLGRFTAEFVQAEWALRAGSGQGVSFLVRATAGRRCGT